MANDLKMRLVLDALDRASRPIRAVSQGSVGLARTLKASRDQLKALQATQNDVSSWQRLRAISTNTETALQGARDKVKALNKEMAATGVPTKQMTRDLRDAIRAATDLKRKHQEQQTELQGLRNKLGAAGISTRNLVQGERELRERIAQTNQTISEQGRRLQRLTAQTKRLAMARAQYDKTQQLAGSMAGTGAGAAALGASAGLPVLSMAKDYMGFEDAMAGVAKQVAGARDDNGNLTSTYFEMADAIKAMGERIPMATTEIAALVEGAARMGVQGKANLLAFTEVAANAATAFELPADEIGENLARIADLYKLPIKNVGQLGDAINYLDDNAKSKGADIIEVLQRTAGITASVGMSYKDAAALGSTFLTLGATAEVAGTATNAMIRELAIATQQPKRFQSGLKALGLEAQALQTGMAKNATGTLQTVLDAINKLPKAEQLSVTTQLFGKEFGDDAAKLAQNIGEYRRQLELANSAAGEGSMQREADIRAQLMSARLQMAQNQVFNLSSALGETLKPTILELIEGFNGVVGRVNAWVKANPELAGQILKTVAGVAALAAGFGAVTLAMASFLGPFAMLRYGLTLLGIKSLGAVTALKGMGGALLWVGKAILWVGRALLMNPIGLAVAAIATAAYLIYKNWAPIKAFFVDIWGQARAAFDQGIGGISKLLLNWSPLGLLYSAFATTMSYLGVEMPAKFSDFGINLMQGLVNGITNGLAKVKTAITGAADSTVGWFKEKLGIHSPSRVFAQLGGFTMQGLEQGLESGQGGPLAAISSIAKQLTAAGAITFGAAGGAIAMDNRPPLSAAPPQAASAAAAPAPIIIHVHPSAGMDEQALARLVQAEVAKAQRAAQTKGRAALSDQE
ncbi:phage tail tape measure protein [Pseudomonas aeruginosa]